MAGNAAMAVGGPWELPRMQAEAKFEWRVALLPVKDGKNIRASSLGGYHFAIPKGAQARSTARSVDRGMSDPALFREGWNASDLLAPRGDVEIADPAWPQAYAAYREQMQTAIRARPASAMVASSRARSRSRSRRR